MADPYEMEELRREIVDAISTELASTPEFMVFDVEEATRLGQVWRMTVEAPGDRRAMLDESLEDAQAWWPEPIKGGARVLSVIPDRQQINLRFATSTPPSAGGRLFIYPPRFLEALLACWNDPHWSHRCIQQYDRLASEDPSIVRAAPSAFPYRWLRQKQREAFGLARFQTGFLWGPPGTGKTRTLGALVAETLIEQPKIRVLLLSTTNSAVDQAVVAVDNALEERKLDGHHVRSACFRIGGNYNASYYPGREHLLATKDVRLVEQLTRLEANRPAKEDVEHYAAWKDATERVRAELHTEATAVLGKAQLAAMTTAFAAFNMDRLRTTSPYDLVVFDEASQVSLAHGLAIAPLGDSTLFAGDPFQLSPIVQSDTASARQWLGSSPFAFKDRHHAATCMLEEQSRMAEPICNLVGNVFYKGKLRVAADASSNRDWRAYRELVPIPTVGAKAVAIREISKAGTWSPNWGGPIRYQSADFIADLVSHLRTHLDDDQILVLTPFRAQRALIRKLLRGANGGGVCVSTVHRAQGTERHTVIFDPTMGSSQFLQTEESRRLVNVAISRAQARLLLLLSTEDLANPLFRRLAHVINPETAPAGFVPIATFAGEAGFPNNAVGKDVEIGDYRGRITQILQGGAKFEFVDVLTGTTRIFLTSVVIAKFAGSAYEHKVPRDRNN